MKRRPTPHLTRKRVSPHPGYVWREYDNDDGEDFRHKEFLVDRRWPQPKPAYRAHKERRKLGLGRAQYAALLQERKRLLAIQHEQFIRDIEDFAAQVPAVPPRPYVLVGTKTFIDQLNSAYKR